MHPCSERVFLLCFVLFFFLQNSCTRLFFNHFDDEKNYILKASLKKNNSWSTGAVTKMNTLIYTRYRSNYKKK